MNETCEIWVIYDRANASYLTGGNWRALEYGRTENPLDSHRYPREDIARKMLKRLNGEIEKANQQTEWHMLPRWNPAEQERLRRNGDDPNDGDCPVLIQPNLCIRRIHSPQVEDVLTF